MVASLNCTLADLYDPLTMPADLRAAHEANDRAVLVNVANVKVLPIANTQYPIHLRQGYGG